MTTEFRKTDAGKPRPSLIPPAALMEVAAVFAYGAKKYAPGNWARCDKRRRYSDAAMRHILAWLAGNDADDESGLPHLAHAAASILMLRGLEIGGHGEDDRERPNSPNLSRETAAIPEPPPRAENAATGNVANVARCCGTCKHEKVNLCGDPCIGCVQRSRWEAKR
jgi:hypothetical protein